MDVETRLPIIDLKKRISQEDSTDENPSFQTCFFAVNTLIRLISFVHFAKYLSIPEKDHALNRRITSAVESNLIKEILLAGRDVADFIGSNHGPLSIEFTDFFRQIGDVQESWRSTDLTQPEIVYEHNVRYLADLCMCRQKVASIKDLNHPDIAAEYRDNLVDYFNEKVENTSFDQLKIECQYASTVNHDKHILSASPGADTVFHEAATPYVYYREHCLSLQPFVQVLKVGDGHEIQFLAWVDNQTNSKRYKSFSAVKPDAYVEIRGQVELPWTAVTVQRVIPKQIYAGREGIVQYVITNLYDKPICIDGLDDIYPDSVDIRSESVKETSSYEIVPPNSCVCIDKSITANWSGEFQFSEESSVSYSLNNVQTHVGLEHDVPLEVLAVPEPGIRVLREILHDGVPIAQDIGIAPGEVVEIVYTIESTGRETPPFRLVEEISGLKRLDHATDIYNGTLDEVGKSPSLRVSYEAEVLNEPFYSLSLRCESADQLFFDAPDVISGQVLETLCPVLEPRVVDICVKERDNLKTVVDVSVELKNVNHSHIKTLSASWVVEKGASAPQPIRQLAVDDFKKGSIASGIFRIGYYNNLPGSCRLQIQFSDTNGRLFSSQLDLNLNHIICTNINLLPQVGREAEEKIIETYLTGTLNQKDEAIAIYVQGPSGVGKEFLIDNSVRRIQQLKHRTVFRIPWINCGEIESVDQAISTMIRKTLLEHEANRMDIHGVQHRTYETYFSHHAFTDKKFEQLKTAARQIWNGSPIDYPRDTMRDFVRYTIDAKQLDVLIVQLANFDQLALNQVSSVISFLKQLRSISKLRIICTGRKTIARIENSDDCPSLAAFLQVHIPTFREEDSLEYIYSFIVHPKLDPADAKQLVSLSHGKPSLLKKLLAQIEANADEILHIGHSQVRVKNWEKVKEGVATQEGWGQAKDAILFQTVMEVFGETFGLDNLEEVKMFAILVDSLTTAFSASDLNGILSEYPNSNQCPVPSLETIQKLLKRFVKLGFIHQIDEQQYQRYGGTILPQKTHEKSYAEKTGPIREEIFHALYKWYRSSSHETDTPYAANTLYEYLAKADIDTIDSALNRQEVDLNLITPHNARALAQRIVVELKDYNPNTYWPLQLKWLEYNVDARIDLAQDDAFMRDPVKAMAHASDNLVYKANLVATKYFMAREEYKVAQTLLNRNQSLRKLPRSADPYLQFETDLVYFQLLYYLCEDSSFKKTHARLLQKINESAVKSKSRYVFKSPVYIEKYLEAYYGIISSFTSELKKHNQLQKLAKSGSNTARPNTNIKEILNESWLDDYLSQDASSANAKRTLGRIFSIKAIRKWRTLDNDKQKLKELSPFSRKDEDCERYSDWIQKAKGYFESARAETELNALNYHLSMAYLEVIDTLAKSSTDEQYLQSVFTLIETSLENARGFVDSTSPFDTAENKDTAFIKLLVSRAKYSSDNNIRRTSVHKIRDFLARTHLSEELKETYHLALSKICFDMGNYAEARELLRQVNSPTDALEIVSYWLSTRHRESSSSSYDRSIDYKTLGTIIDNQLNKIGIENGHCELTFNGFECDLVSLKGHALMEYLSQLRQDGRLRDCRVVLRNLLSHALDNAPVVSPKMMSMLPLFEQIWRDTNSSAEAIVEDCMLMNKVAKKADNFEYVSAVFDSLLHGTSEAENRASKNMTIAKWGLMVAILETSALRFSILGRRLESSLHKIWPCYKKDLQVAGTDIAEYLGRFVVFLLEDYLSAIEDELEILDVQKISDEIIGWCWETQLYNELCCVLAAMVQAYVHRYAQTHNQHCLDRGRQFVSDIEDYEERIGERLSLDTCDQVFDAYYQFPDVRKSAIDLLQRMCEKMFRTELYAKLLEKLSFLSDLRQSAEDKSNIRISVLRRYGAVDSENYEFLEDFIYRLITDVYVKVLNPIHRMTEKDSILFETTKHLNQSELADAVAAFHIKYYSQLSSGWCSHVWSFMTLLPRLSAGVNMKGEEIISLCTLANTDDETIDGRLNRYSARNFLISTRARNELIGRFCHGDPGLKIVHQVLEYNRLHELAVKCGTVSAESNSLSKTRKRQHLDFLIDYSRTEGLMNGNGYIAEQNKTGEIEKIGRKIEQRVELLNTEINALMREYDMDSSDVFVAVRDYIIRKRKEGKKIVENFSEFVEPYSLNQILEEILHYLQHGERRFRFFQHAQLEYSKMKYIRKI